ncbi:MAG TPA: thiosulfate oxidation carrier protein SoxY [Nitrospirae bacterium]|nr:thiosulfate oxidation carrier protein SoxY [Nitrospirota bacterium]
MIMTGLACAAVVSSSSIGSLLKPAVAEGAKKPEKENINDVLKKFFGDRKIEMSHVKLKTPIIAENGAVVPVTIISDLPMEKDNYVKKIYIFVDENYHPFTASAELSPANGKAALALRIKMRKTSNVRAILETNTGKLYGAQKAVKVTIGGCGG